MEKHARLSFEALEKRDLPATYVVTNNFDNGYNDVRVGSLRWAAEQANYITPGLDSINFNLPAGQRVINLKDPVFFNGQIALDGKSQPGYAGQPLVSIIGGAGAVSLIGLVAGSSGSTVQGLAFADVPYTDISIFSGSDANWIQDNWIGFYVDADGDRTPDQCDQGQRDSTRGRDPVQQQRRPQQHDLRRV